MNGTTETTMKEERRDHASAERERVAALVGSAVDGDPRAFRDLMETFQSTFYGLAMRYAGSHQNADDVLQDAFVKIYQNLSTLSAPEAFFPWARRVLINTALDRIRRERRTSEVEVASDDPEIAERESAFDSPDRGVQRREFYRKLERAIEALPPRQREVVTLHDVEGLTTDEVAEQIGVPRATVRSNLFYAREKLRATLSRYRDEP